MRRWNGWGDESTHYPLPPSAADFLRAAVGEGASIPDAGLPNLLSQVPKSRLPALPFIEATPESRLLHARGQSLPDWVALRHGQIETFPDGVAFPQTDEDIRLLLEFAARNQARLIPYGGGTSVVGHINPLPGADPVLTVDLGRMNRLLDLDEASRLAAFEAGVCGPDLEAALNRRGYTLGHFPQSFELSTLGGWIATRSSGQQSYHYGRIEDLFAGGHVETPCGPLDFPNLPASAAGPDLRQVFLGSEGRFGILTRAALRVRPLPEVEGFYGAFFPDWAAGIAAVRELAQERVPLSMLRLSNPLETATTLELSGKEKLVSLANRGLGLLSFRQPSLLIYGVTGERPMARIALSRANAAIRKQGGLPTGALIGKMWRKSRFLTPYLRNTLWERGYALDTLETALPWAAVEPLAEQVLSALPAAIETFGERLLVFAHLSHVYRDGASLYVTYLFRRSADPDETLARWQAMKRAASLKIVAAGGTISHQHGVGVDHASYLADEKSAVGMRLLSAASRELDPDGLLNPGKLLLTIDPRDL